MRIQQGFRLSAWLLGVMLVLGLTQARADQRPATAPADSSQPAPAPDAAAKFDVWEYRVLGNTKLEPIEIERTLYPLLGPGKTFENVEEARTTLEKRYHDLGFGTAYVDIPEQKIEDGIVRLRVTEGKLARVHVMGARYFADRVILQEVGEARSGNVPDLHDLQSELALVNQETPDRAVVPVLHAGETPGTVDLDLKVQDHLPLHGSLEMDNAHTVDTDSLRLTALLSYDNLFQMGNSLSVQYQTAPQSPSEIEVFAGTYVFKFGPGKPALALYAVNTNSDVAALGTLNVLGAGDIFGARLVFPLTQSASRNDSVTLGVDYKKFRNTINVTTDTIVPTNVNYLPFSISYASTLADKFGSTNLSASLTWAFRGLVSRTSAFENTREGAPTDFAYLRATAGRLQQLPWGFAAQAQIDGQLSSSPLIANEEFTIGGASSVRGYYETEDLGDEGFHGSFELHSPVWRRDLWQSTQIYLFGFYDWANVQLQNPLSGQRTSDTLRSTGVGFRFNTLGKLDAYLDWARPLTRGVRTPADVNRYNFSVKYGF
jgi:hemolysin activation/secretion protein